MPGGAFSARLPPDSRGGEGAAGKGSAGESEADAAIGPRLVQLVRTTLQGTAEADLAGREQDVLQLLRALQAAYSDKPFQAELQALHEKFPGNEVALLSAMGPAAAAVQGPVFSRFGLPVGPRGVMLMKMAVRAVGSHSGPVRELAGDLRELLGLQREEADPRAVVQEADARFRDLSAKLARAPLDVRGPLAEALRLPYKASPEEIAKEVPKIAQIADELAEKSMQRPRDELVGDGQLLGPDLRGASDAEVRNRLAQSFEHYLLKMLSRVVTPLDSFTRSPSEFRCDWAESVVGERHARELWGPQPPPGAGQDLHSPWLALGIGVTVADGVVDRVLTDRARVELAALEAAGEVHASKDPCNIGARSVWLHFDTEEERRKVPPALREVSEYLTGLPAALEARAVGAGLSDVPKLRVHPHIMAATYCRGAEYHIHKDSYGGTDNQRMLTVLLYLNPEWRPGDGGELRLFRDGGAPRGAKLVSGEPARPVEEEGSFVDVAPLDGRLVIFRSREVWHAVREPREQRWALTLWVMSE